ncbi:MAG TPA: amino acid permease [Pyrinomonadaceae bacterium]|nr:amino acid permease [Pyrinomonadaceae bacterium]
MAEQHDGNQLSGEGLVRGIGRWDLVAVAVNGIIGAGIFGLPSKAFQLTGSYSLIAFVVCGAVLALIILCFAEVGSRYDETGGPYLYAREAFGSLVGFEVGWLIWLVRITAFAANCNLLVSYVGFFSPAVTGGWPRALIIAAVVLTLTTINFIGVRQAVITTNIFTVGKLVPIILFIALGLFYLNPSNYSFAEQPSIGSFSQAVLLLVYAFSGFEMASIPAGEVRNPRRNLPFAILVAIAVVAVIYILIQIVSVGTLPELASSERPLADAASRFMGTAGGAVISAGAIISITGNLNVVLLSGSRMPFAMAERKELPSLLGKTHNKFHTPHVAILITAAIVLAVTLSGTFIYALTISTLTRLVSYAVTCAALPLLRRREDVPPAEFKVHGGEVIALLVLILAAWLLSNSTLREARDATIAAATGLAVYFLYKSLRR